MAAYSFNRDFVGPVLSGEKRLTIRTPRTGSTRHANVGNSLHLTGWNACIRETVTMTIRPCVLRASVLLGPDRVVRAWDIKADGSEFAGSLSLLLAAAEQASPEAAHWSDELAVLDGFSGYAALYAWQLANSGKGAPDAAGCVARELIAWGAA